MEFTTLSLATLLTETAPAPSSGADFAVWRWVIIIPAVIIAIFFVLRRISGVVEKKRTDEIIRSVGEGTDNGDYKK